MSNIIYESPSFWCFHVVIMPFFLKKLFWFGGCRLYFLFLLPLVFLFEHCEAICVWCFYPHKLIVSTSINLGFIFPIRFYSWYICRDQVEIHGSFSQYVLALYIWLFMLGIVSVNFQVQTCDCNWYWWK